MTQIQTNHYRTTANQLVSRDHSPKRSATRIASQSSRSPGELTQTSPLMPPTPDMARASLDLTQKIIDRCGPRLAGSAACQKSAQLIEEELKPYCDSVQIKEFGIHPDSFLFFFRLCALTYTAALIPIFVGGWTILLAALLLSAGTVFAFCQFVFYRSTFDIFFKKKIGYNVLGVIEPTFEARQQIIVSGHHDSAYEFNFLKPRWQRFYSLRIVLGAVFYLALTLACVIWAGDLLFFGHSLAEYTSLIRSIALIGAVFVLGFYFFLGKKGTPGAGDNLIGTAIAIQLARAFGRADQQDIPVLRHTRLIAASFDAEECGLRGARAYAKQHLSQLATIPTTVFNIDSIYKLDQLKFLSSDINGNLKLSSAMAERCQQVATELGYRTRVVPMVFGGGATDAAEFARIGVEATTLLGISTDFVREGLTYHTRDDTVENIEPASVAAAFDIGWHYILQKDQETYCKH